MNHSELNTSPDGASQAGSSSGSEATLANSSASVTAGVSRHASRPSARSALLDALQRRHDAGQPVQLWLRDDDAVEPTEALDQLLSMTGAHAVPVTLAVIPAFSGQALSQRLSAERHVDVAVHGWAHVNHAPVTDKKQELGTQRSLEDVCGELQRGLLHLQHWHTAQCMPVLVPPWNRISASLVPTLPSLGFKALSTFAQTSFESIAVVNTHVDIIDWRGNRAGRPADELFAEVTARLLAGHALTGILAHHLVHDQQAWQFLEQLFELTADHPAVQWTALRQLVSV